MQITPIAADIETWITPRLTTAPRSVGHHVSVLVLGMLKELVPKKYGEYGQGKKDREPIYEMGYLWEDLLGAILTDRVMLDRGEVLLTGQTEIERDGIFGTPDRLVLGTDGAVIVEETKITWKWYSPDLEAVKFLYWLLQVKTYCAMVGATTARIRALFINEISHSDNFVVPGCWEITFEPHELDEWWESLLSFASTFTPAPLLES